MALPETWATKMLQQVAVWEQAKAQASAHAAEETYQALAKVRKRLSKLLDAHLDAIIEQKEYREKKAELLNQKLALEQQLGRTGNQWLEPLKNWIQEARHAWKLAFSENEAEKAVFLVRIGSNLHPTGGAVSVTFKKPWRFAAARQNSAAGSATSFQRERSERFQKKSFSDWQGRRESNPQFGFWRPVVYH